MKRKNSIRTIRTAVLCIVTGALLLSTSMTWGSDFSDLPDTIVYPIRAPYVNFNKNKGRWEIQYSPEGKGEQALVCNKEDTCSTVVTVGTKKMSWTFRTNFKDYTTTDNLWVFDHPKGRVIKQSPYNSPLTPNDLTLPEQGHPWKVRNSIPSDVCYVDRDGNGIGYNGQVIKAGGKGAGNDISTCFMPNSTGVGRSGDRIPAPPTNP